MKHGLCLSSSSWTPLVALLFACHPLNCAAKPAREIKSKVWRNSLVRQWPSSIWWKFLWVKSVFTFFNNSSSFIQVGKKNTLKKKKKAGSMIFYKVTWKGVGIFNPAVFQIGDDVFWEITGPKWRLKVKNIVGWSPFIRAEYFVVLVGRSSHCKLFLSGSPQSNTQGIYGKGTYSGEWFLFWPPMKTVLGDLTKFVCFLYLKTSHNVFCTKFVSFIHFKMRYID